MSLIQIEKNESTLVIGFNRPEKKNALTIEMYNQMNQALISAAEDNKIKSVLFSSTSDDFTAGNDVVDFRDNPPIDDSAPVYSFVRALAKFNKPLIAAVDGLAVGLGFTMLLHCDFVYVTERTKMLAPFVNLGLIPEAGSSQLLVDLVGHRKAAEIVMLGKMLSGKEATRLGIATEVVSTDELKIKALGVAAELGQKPRESLEISRKLLRPKKELSEVVEKEIVEFKKRVTSAETKEAIAAILEKRKPNFSQFEN